MAYPDYADYSTLTGEERLTRLRLHIVEVRQQLLATTTIAVASDGKSMTRKDLETYLASLTREEQSLSSAVGGGAVGRARLSRRYG